MRKTLSCVMAAALALTSLAVPAAQSAPRTSVPVAAKAPSAVTDVQYYHYPRGYHRGYGYRDRYYHRRRGNQGAAVAAGVVGLAAGVLAAQALAQPRYAPPPAYYGGGSDWYAYCASRYRSFDPRSGTYLGYDGRRHYCR